MASLAKDAYFGDPAISAQRYHRSAEFQEIRTLIPAKKGRALDLGAGNGILSWALAKEGWDVTAVEPDKSELVGAGAIRQLALQPGIKINVIEAFGEAIPLASAGFDLIVARQVLHHAKSLPAFCKEMARLGKPGTTVLTLRDHVISGPQQLQPFLDSHPLHHRYGGENAFTLSDYRSALLDAGIAIDRQYLSVQSVLNYDPMKPQDIKNKIALSVGALSPVARLAMKIIPDHLLFQIVGHLDRRPGRLVSFAGQIT
jgi:SAM-dependent methyltransferase